MFIALQAAALVAAAGCLGACVVETASEEEGIPAAETEGLTMNGLTMNGLTMNGLTMNGLTMNGLTMNGLAMNGLAMNGLTAAKLVQNSSLVSVLDVDANARLAFSYIISCALPKGEDVVFPMLAGAASFTFSGELGLAPDWSSVSGVCGPYCQRAISACVIARVNALGQHVSISLRSHDAGLALSQAERVGYTHREATYFGNIFTGPKSLYACRAAEDDQTLVGRVCGHGADVSACAVTVLGDCHGACAQSDATDGWFATCKTPYDGVFVPAVTVFRQ